MMNRWCCRQRGWNLSVVLIDSHFRSSTSALLQYVTLSYVKWCSTVHSNGKPSRALSSSAPLPPVTLDAVFFVLPISFWESSRSSALSSRSINFQLRSVRDPEVKSSPARVNSSPPLVKAEEKFQVLSNGRRVQCTKHTVSRPDTALHNSLSRFFNQHHGTRDNVNGLQNHTLRSLRLHLFCSTCKSPVYIDCSILGVICPTGFRIFTS
ncbi:hypothetical protein Mapa_010245 [Marchantia paleacea]|nr:hypothetical protein Mapa_010245 [Marchantia paleacea]